MTAANLEVSAEPKKVQFQAGDRVWIKYVNAGPYIITGSPNLSAAPQWQGRLLTLIPQKDLSSARTNTWVEGANANKVVALDKVLTHDDPNPPVQPWSDWWHENKSELVRMAISGAVMAFTAGAVYVVTLEKLL